MAYASRNTTLVDGLITSVTRQSKDATGFRKLRDAAIRGLRDQSAARTNQFDIWSKLDGLIEKFGVLNRDDLAGALQSRLDELPKQGSKWQPETLSLLLLLSDRPTEKINLSNLDHNPDQVDNSGIAYSETLDDDPLTEPGLWEDVQRGYHSSGDEEFIDGGSEPAVSTRATSINDDDLAMVAPSFVQTVKQDSGELASNVQTSSHTQTTSHESHAVSDISAIRETLLMIRGLPTSLFTGDQSTGFSPYHDTFLATAAHRTSRNLLSECAELANSLLPLRIWLGTQQTTPSVQAMQGSIAKMLNKFDLDTARYDRRFISPDNDTIVSIVGMLDDLRKLSRPSVNVSRAIQSYTTQDSEEPFSLIDGLYEDACTAHLAGDDEILIVFADLVWAGLATYLKDLDAWMEHGELPSGDSTFFAFEADTKCDLADMYHKRFATRLLSDGRPSAPRLLSTSMDKAFAMGKSRAFMSALPFQVKRTIPRQHIRKLVSFEALLSDMELSPFLPLPELIRQALDGWFDSSSQDSATALGGQLLSCEKGLFAMLNVLEIACCSRDGILFEAFADGLFTRIDALRSDWHGRYMLTELARDTLGSHPWVDASALSVHTPVTVATGPEARRSCRDLEDIQLSLRIPWYLQNITREATPESHGKTFAFLLQLYRAKSVLRTALFDHRSTRYRPANVRLRQSLMWLVDTITSHCTVAVQTLGHDVRQELKAAAGIDAMAASYAAYKKRLDVNLIIGTNFKPLRETITDLLDLCVRSSSCGGTTEAEHREIEGIEPARLHSTLFSNESAEVMRRHYAKWLGFLVAGLRGVSRSSGERMLEELAEKLEWGLG